MYAILSIGFLGFLVWGHHMFMSGMNPYSAMAFSVLTMCIGVPSAIKTFNWIGSFVRLEHADQPPCCSRSGFVSLFVTGGVSGIFLGQPALDLYFHDTYFVVGHFHMIMGVAAIFGMFAGTYLLVPQDVRPHDERDPGQNSLLLTFIGDYCIFTPMHFLGLVGNPAATRISRIDYLAAADAGAQVHDLRRLLHRRRADIFLFNLFWST